MKKVILSFALALIATAGFSQASNEFSHTVTLTLTDVFEIEKTSESADNLSFTFDDGDDYTDGLTNSAAAEIQVRSNKDWQVNVKADAANFANATTANTATMPASVLSVKESSATAYLTLSTTDQQIKTGSAGGFIAANTFSVDYQANPGFTYPADTYTIDVVYTVSAQ